MRVEIQWGDNGRWADVGRSALTDNVHCGADMPCLLNASKYCILLLCSGIDTLSALAGHKTDWKSRKTLRVAHCQQLTVSWRFWLFYLCHLRCWDVISCAIPFYYNHITMLLRGTEWCLWARLCLWLSSRASHSSGCWTSPTFGKTWPTFGKILTESIAACIGWTWHVWSGERAV